IAAVPSPDSRDRSPAGNGRAFLLSVPRPLSRGWIGPTRRAAMRSILFVLALAAVAACPLQAQGRLALPVPLAGDKDTITTSIDDALPVATHLERIDGLTPLPLPASFEFGPGYYRGDVRSYCRHAGTYGPTSGDGYLVAPLKGSHADIISGILARSAQHPEIER